VEAKTLETQEKCINHDVKLEKEVSFKDTNEQETNKETKETPCCHANDGKSSDAIHESHAVR
jgi:hypothetical protein